MFSTLLVAVLFSSLSLAQCPGSPNPVNSIKPISAPGWNWSVVSTGFRNPRSILFDSAGRLIVLASGTGIAALELEDNGGTCVKEKSRKYFVTYGKLNHGLALSRDGKTIYASSSATAFSWPYDAQNNTVGENSTIITGMDNDDHTTRTLTISQFANMMYVSRGSNSNIDPGANYLFLGRSQIRAFDITTIPAGGYDYSSMGTRLGWGLRNSVGIAEHPATGGIYSVENSCDQYTRDNVDIHQDNPGEEMNYHGTLLNNSYARQGGNYGYPNCFAAWNATELPNNTNITTGTQFANASSFDYLCSNVTAPRLTFEAHMAPLDIKFNDSTAFVTFHGSWDRSSPSGYKLSIIDFNAMGEPVALSDSNTSYNDVFSNADNSKCPNNCFRPVGMAFDQKGRLFVSSDYSGEIYVLMRNT